MSALIPIEPRQIGGASCQQGTVVTCLPAGATQFKSWLTHRGESSRFDGRSNFGSSQSRARIGRQLREYVLSPGMVWVLAMTERPGCGEGPRRFFPGAGACLSVGSTS